MGRVSLRCSAGRCGAPVSGFVGAGAADDPDADVAEEEGFDEIARAFRNIAKVEGAHRDRYQKLHDNVENGKVFEKDEKVIWKCGNCGFLYEGKVAPKICPACAHKQEWFEVAAFNY